MEILESKSLEDTEQIAKEWLGSLKPGSFVGLSGHLGAGKTAFTKAVAKILGVEEEVTSPTFVIMKIYETKNEIFKRLVHIDAYRLEKRGELAVLELDKVREDPHNLIMMEWPENAELSTFEPNCFLRFEIKDGKRIIEIK